MSVSSRPRFQTVAPELWAGSFPLNFLGMRLGRRVTLVRLPSGKLVIHSTARFDQADRREIEALGTPGWLIDATNFHDTFARPGRTAFPSIPYLVPTGFPGAAGLQADSLLPAPEEWSNHLELVRIGGIPKLNEHALFHRSSRSLIVADLVFNLSPEIPAWTRISLRAFSGLRTEPSVSRLFRFMIKDREAFEHSVEALAALDARRLIPAHGEIFEGDVGALLRRLFLKR